MAFEESLTQGLSIQDVLNSAVINATTAYSVKQIDMSTVKRAIYIFQGGANGGGWTAALVGCATANIAATNVAITGCNSGSITGNNQIATLEVRSDQLTNLNSTYRYVRAVVNTTGATTVVGCVGLGGQGIQKPASQYSLNTTFLAAQNTSTI